jgi:hypothetical protein
MDSLKQRLLSAAHHAADFGPNGLRDHDIVNLLREAAGAIAEPRVNERGNPRRAFDSTLTKVLAFVIYDSGLHTQHREDTIGVLMRCGAFHAEEVEAARDGFIADLADAIDSVKPERWQTGRYSVEKAKFGDVKIGEHFVCWPIPGDNHGHGGYLGQHRLFVKTAEMAPDMPHSGLAKNGSGIESSFPHSNAVIRVILS